MGHTRLGSDHLLGAQGEQGRPGSRQRVGLVERIRVQRLRATEHCGQGLQRGAHEIHLGLLRRQCHTGCLGVES